ncbi:neuron navigator 3-like isoform X2 [Paramacrobiotus metropolitanus]|uniref:neuron navigator 3-like isoform X2 n=1 Tax=Paramacrobiotus metropolitanus TaxID=2943436 RepID=UPI00244584F7|nr:neuron navigator 3-like isoform X2 [Paramacrobiotus metropolitanus]
MSMRLWTCEHNNANIKKIYTDWANHYLERSSRHKRLIQDLQQDITDGVLLADVIEAVTNEKLRDIKQKPKSDAQILDNISVCLKCIDNLGVNTEGLQAEDIKNGNLRAILGLFFSLSRYKQQKKAASQLASAAQPHFPSVPPNPAHNPVNPVTDTMLPKLPSPFKSTNANRNSTGAIPQNVSVPAAGGQNRRSLTNAEKERTAFNGFNSGILPPRQFAQNSRPISPGASGSPHSLIPVPSSKLPLPGDKGNRQNRSSSSINSTTSSVSSVSKGPLPAGPRLNTKDTQLIPGTLTPTASQMGKNSVFGFGGFFKHKQDKHASEKVTKVSSSEHSDGSSSSGFGSAKSADNSDSSVTGSEHSTSIPNIRREIQLNGNMQRRSFTRQPLPRRSAVVQRWL